MKDLLDKHLILVQAFPANSILSEGIIKYLETIFEVDFIDLPGFHKDIAPLNKISIPNYAKYVERQVEILAKGDYILGGISFGAMVANNTKVDDRCLAILDTAPFLGVEYLNLGKSKIKLLNTLVKILVKNDIGVKIWKKEFFRQSMINLLERDSEEVDILLEHVDPKTFLETGKLLLNYRQKPKLQSKPHILLMNPEDEVVDFDDVLEYYRENVDPNQLRVIISNLSHYPDNPDFNYFLKNITSEQIHSLLSFFEYLKESKTSKIFSAKQS